MDNQHEPIDCYAFDLSVGDTIEVFEQHFEVFDIESDYFDSEFLPVMVYIQNESRRISINPNKAVRLIRKAYLIQIAETKA